MKNFVILIAILFLFNIVLNTDPPLIFDVDTEILDETKTVYPGNSVIVNANVRSLGLGSRELIDINLIFKVLDQNNRVILKQESTVALQTSLSISEIIYIPNDMKPGMYYVYVEANYKGYRGYSSEAFYVKRKSIFNIGKLFNF